MKKNSKRKSVRANKAATKRANKGKGSSKGKKSGKKSGRPSSGKTGKMNQRKKPSSAKRGNGRVATGKKTQGSKKT